MILEHLSLTRSCSHPVTLSMPLCVCVRGVWLCEHECVRWRQRLSHSVNLLVIFSMNHNMQLNINHCISFGASYTDAYHPSQITDPEKTQRKRTLRALPLSDFYFSRQARLFDYLLQWWMLTESGIKSRWRKHITPSRFWYAVNRRSGRWLGFEKNMFDLQKL